MHLREERDFEAAKDQHEPQAPWLRTGGTQEGHVVLAENDEGREEDERSAGETV